MKPRGTRNGILLSLDAKDTPETARGAQPELLARSLVNLPSVRWATPKALEVLVTEAGGNEAAFIWAQQVQAKQFRTAGALAQAGGDLKTVSDPEVAQLHNGQIILRPCAH